MRTAFPAGKFETAAGHQCQFGVDYPKPTRLLGNFAGVNRFGSPGWPVFDANDYYTGPLSRSCGHQHRAKTIGSNADGTFHTSPTAAYPPEMCRFIAEITFAAWCKRLTSGAPLRMGSGASAGAPPPHTPPPGPPAPPSARRGALRNRTLDSADAPSARSTPSGPRGAAPAHTHQRQTAGTVLDARGGAGPGGGKAASADGERGLEGGD